jgi:FtsP/CotA-like multicopper oxidase with cupredoxin domain
MRWLVSIMVLASMSGGCAGEKDKGPLPIDLGPWTNPQPVPLEDLDPDPMGFEAELTAAPAIWEYAPGAKVRGLAYNDLVPGPLIRVPSGARVRVHFQNDLPSGFDTTIHWHGIEGNNAADGTHVTQSGIMPGEGFEYHFVVTRPGLYWYHPHARGAQGVFEGLYAPLIVDDPDEASLIEQGILPSDERILVLSDLSEFEGKPISAEVDNPMEIMNGTEGKHLLVNGREDPVFEVPAGGAVRLRLVNTSITRFWRLAVPGHVLYRVGGEGGLLDTVRVEGGAVTGRAESLADGSDLGEVEVPLGYARGEILLAPAERADVVLVPQGASGDEIELRWEDYARGRHGMWMEGDEMVMGDLEDDGKRPGEPVATFRIMEGEGSGWTLSEGDPILGAVGREVGAVDTEEALDWTGESAMVLSERMDMWEDDAGIWQMSTELFVDGESWHPSHMTGAAQSEAPTAVRARLGDTLLWEARNESEMAHPLHIHGFSYQPVSFVRTDEEAGIRVRWELGYDEFEDTTLLPGETSVLLRMRLDDPVGNGGGAGRWMRHCHILQHGENGMMSELIVEP